MNLNIGCGNLLYKDCINVDVKPLEGIDVVADVTALPFKSGSINTVIANHVFEHIPRQRIYDVLGEWKRVLKNKGKLCLECPDFIQNCRDLLNAKTTQEIMMNMMFIFGGDSEAPEDGHRWGYDDILLKSVLKQAGFRQVTRINPVTFHTKQAACVRMEAIK